MKVLFLILTAVIGSVLGNFSGGMLLSRFVFRKKAKKYARADVSFIDFYADFGPLGAVLLILFDALKAVLAVLIGRALMGVVGLPVIGKLFGLFCLEMGQAFPVLFLFKGSKSLLGAGIAAFLIDWRVGLCCWVAYIVIIVFTRFVALGSVAGAILCPIFMWIFGFDALTCVLGLLTALIFVVKYAENIVRMIGGTEPRLNLTGVQKKAPEGFEDEDDA